MHNTALALRHDVIAITEFLSQKKNTNTSNTQALSKKAELYAYTRQPRTDLVGRLTRERPDINKGSERDRRMMHLCTSNWMVRETRRQ